MPIPSRGHGTRAQTLGRSFALPIRYLRVVVEEGRNGSPIVVQESDHSSRAVYKANDLCHEIIQVCTDNPKLMIARSRGRISRRAPVDR